MKVIYKLNEDDIKKILADHFEALPEDIQFQIERQPEGIARIRIQIDTVLE